MQLVGKYIFAALFVFCSQSAIAQEYPFIKYTPKDGLVSSRVQNFYQDTKGRIFFMTVDGLSLYDGARFLNYTVNDGLANPVVNDVLEITPDSILVASNTGSLNAWVRGAIKTIKTLNGFCPVINKFYRNKDKVIYVVTDQGLFRLDKDIFIPLPIFYMKGELVKPLEQIEEIGDYFLLKEFDERDMSHTLLFVNKNTLATSSPFKNKHISSLVPVTVDNLLLAVADNQLLSFDLEAAGKGILKQKEFPARYSLLKSYALSKIFVDQTHNIWAIAGSAILRCGGDGQIQSFDKTNGLNATNLFSVGVDRENILWVLTAGSGVLKLVNKNVQIISGQIANAPADFTAIYSGDSGNVWMFNAENGSLYCQNKNGLKKWQLDSSVRVSNISMRKGILLLFGDNKIFEARPSGKKNNQLSLKKIYHNENDSINFAKAETDKNGNVYLPGSMITVFTPSGDVFRTELPDFIDQITFDEQQQLWTVTRMGDLLCYQIQSGLPGNPLELKFHDKLNISAPRSITVDKKGKIWIGTRYAGLYCLEYNRRKLVFIRNWSTKEMLTDNFIYYLTCDRNNVIWAGTQSGLNKISGSGDVVESITRNNNIYQIIQKIQMGVNNEIWTLGSGGIISIHDEGLAATDYKPQLQIVRMVSGGKVLNLPLNSTILPSSTHQVTIDVAAPSFIDEKHITYSYMLDGNEKGEWSPATNHATFHLINLQPGDYTLRIKVFFPVSEYMTEELVYHFIILPPWWQAWWFRLLLVVALGIAFVLMIRTYYQKKLQRQKINFEKQRAIELERTRIAMEMHDDLGSGLTSIRYLATGLNSASPALVKEKAIKIQSSAKQLVDSMNDIIWTLKSDNNNLSETLNYIRKQAAELLESVGMDYHFDFPGQVDEIKMSNEQKRNLILISKEAVHNAIKHSSATSLSIAAIRKRENLYLSFSDNGKGFINGEGKFAGYGLLNMQKRATELGATIQIQHDPGTTITLIMKLK